MPKLGVTPINGLLTIKKRLQGKGVGAILVRGASGSFLVLMIGAIMAFGTNMLLARIMGVTQYGIYVYTLTWINILTMLCKLGMDTSSLRFIAMYNAKNEWGLLRGILSRSIQLVLLASTFIGVGASLVVWLLYEKIGSDQALTYWIAFLLLPLLGLTSLRTAALRAFKHVVQAGLPDSIFQRTTIAILAIFSYLYIQQYLQASLVMVFNVTGTLVAFVVGTIWLIRALPVEIHSAAPVYLSKEWLKVSLPLFFMSGMSMILNQTGIVLVGLIVDTENAGVYAVSVRISGLIIFGLLAANMILAPMISELYSTKKYRELQRLITLSARGIFVFTLVIGIGLAVFGKYLLGLFGEDFVAGYISLLILLSGQAVNALTGSVGLLMAMTGHQKEAAKIIGASAVLNIFLNLLFIPAMGMSGAAISTAISLAVVNLAMLYTVWCRLNINPTILARI